MMGKILFVALAALTLACGKDPSGPAVTDRFVLVRLNGLSLPYVRLQSGSNKEEVLAGQILLKADGSYSDRTTFRSTQGSVSSTYNETLQGPFDRTETSITFTVISEDDPSGDDTYSGTFNSDTLTIQVGTTIWKYVER